jgi:hypothetical protein
MMKQSSKEVWRMMACKVGWYVCDGVGVEAGMTV